MKDAKDKKYMAKCAICYRIETTDNQSIESLRARFSPIKGSKNQFICKRCDNGFDVEVVV